MGMFDTIIFDRPIPCPKCGAEIRSDQTKAFECTLDDAATAVAVASATASRTPRISASSAMTCTARHARRSPTRYYLAVYRGVLVGIEQEREAAEALLRSFNFEKLLLWYHDLYRKRERARGQPIAPRCSCTTFVNGSRAATTSWRRKIGGRCCSSGIGTSSKRARPLWRRCITSWPNARPRRRPATITGK